MSEDVRRIEIVADRDRPSAFTLRVDGTEQSYVDLDDPRRLEFDYIQRMADVIDGHGTAGEPLRCVHIGGAGMTLARYVAATRPRSAQIVLEPDEEITALVRERMPLPRHSGIKVRPVDGRTGIAAMRDDFADVVVLDAFDGDQVPAELTTREFFAELSRVTTPGGLVLLNLADHAPFPYLRRAVRGVLDAFAEVMISAEPATLKGRRFGNVLVVASQATLPWETLARRAASSPLPYRVLPYREVVQGFAAKTAFTDQDSQPSPARPRLGTFFG
ncbi:spermidine synthase [Aeromicrobium wangtongii]|uniref:spermidine synthase n=1 Tax=Aeromicrobium wangtongii TaxID=2969247 RepID=UPI002017E458|nr:fused MFS/spermidine synthase [Aeromicrobium wangtongii]MCL3819159.1 fused MFS/spermidine synthase [Aeromicrobium wangtongii]